MRSLIEAGMNVARLNFSHGTYKEKAERIQNLCALREEMGVPLALLADTRGPEIRLGKFPDGPVRLREGQTFTLVAADIEGDERRAGVSYPGLPADVCVGGHLMLDDGLIDLRVEGKTDTEIACTVLNGGKISSYKGVNAPGVKLRLPFITSQDRADLRFIAQHPFSYVAASFTRTAEDIRSLRDEITRHGATDIKVIAKIENAEGLRNIDAIMDVADGIMVARGDLGVETPLEELPVLQKQLIQNAYRRGMPVITATQMLESMIKNPRPTRAETSDVANAVYDGTSAVMLSGETAAGAYPAEACACMARIAERTERDIDYKKRFITRGHTEENTITNAVARAAVTIAHELNCQAILTMSETGRTARHVSKYRPDSPIIACTPNVSAYHQLSLIWGVSPLIIPECEDMDTLTAVSMRTACSSGLLREGDIAVVTAGIPLGLSGATNLLKVIVTGEEIRYRHPAKSPL
jgi:pyruvate kinase